MIKKIYNVILRPKIVTFQLAADQLKCVTKCKGHAPKRDLFLE